MALGPWVYSSKIPRYYLLTGKHRVWGARCFFLSFVAEWTTANLLGHVFVYVYRYTDRYMYIYICIFRS